MTSVKLLDHLDTGAAVLGDLINVRPFEQSEADIGMPQAVAGADVAIAVELQIQLVEDGVHQLARRFPEYPVGRFRSEEHTSELQSLMRISYAVFCLKKQKHNI